MLNLETYYYVVKFYYKETFLATYIGCVRPVEVHLDWRVENGVMKTLSPIVKRQAWRRRKQRISSVDKFKRSSRCCNYHCIGQNSNWI